jgi:hypothetical protein
MRVESTIFGIRIENIDSTEEQEVLQLEPTMTIRFSKDRRNSNAAETSAVLPSN